MKIPPNYELNNGIVSLLGKIEANRAIIDSFPLPIAIEENFRRASLLGSSLFSAKIEGNSLTENDVSDFRDLTSKEKEKIEVANLMRAIKYVLEKYDGKKEITEKDILYWHKLAMNEGRYRIGQEGIFDQGGNLIYHAPPPSQIKLLISDLLKFANNGQEPILIRAILSHFILEKIHPFVDGNGRIGRLLQLAILAKNGYAMKGMVVVEKEINEKRQLYYKAIEENDSTEFLQLMLEFLVIASEKAKDKILMSKKYNNEDLLAPRRRELLEIIREHRMVSFDFLHRRFLAVNERLLAYDLKFLMDNGYIDKVGVTRGVLYQARG